MMSYGREFQMAFTLLFCPPPPRRGAEYCYEYVCLSACISQKPHCWTSQNFLFCVVWGPGSVFWQCCDTLMYLLFCGWQHVITQWSLWCMTCVFKQLECNLKLLHWFQRYRSASALQKLCAGAKSAAFDCSFLKYVLKTTPKNLHIYSTGGHVWFM